MEAALWLFSTAVQGDTSAQKQGLAVLPDLVRLLDTGDDLSFPFKQNHFNSWAGRDTGNEASSATAFRCCLFLATHVQSFHSQLSRR